MMQTNENSDSPIQPGSPLDRRDPASRQWPIRCVLHIGYYKTATTFLQNAVFGGIPQIVNLGKPVRDPDRYELVRHIHHALDHDFDLDTWRAKLDGWYERAIDGNRQAACAVFSMESLAAPEGLAQTNPDMVPARLKALFGDAQVLITIREQASLVESLYLHNAKVSRFRLLREWLEDHENEIANLDFDAKLNAFAKAFGAENVHILPQEMLRQMPDRAKQILALALTIDDALIAERMKEASPLNTRRSQRELLYNRVRSILAPNVAVSRFLPGWFIARKNRFLSAGKRAEGILGDSMRGTIRSRFAASNAMLEKRTGLPLTSLGYATE